MDKHSSHIARPCNYQLVRIGKIRKYSSDNACKSLVQALVTGRLD